MQFAQMSPVVGVQGHGERAAAAVAEVVARELGEFGARNPDSAGGDEVQAEQGLLAVVQLP
ncbi:hypothetical protein GCM10011428_39030 [Streptomyces violaceus]